MPVSKRALPLRGFREFDPDLMAARRRILSAWRTVALRYGFQEYDGPPLEPLDLYLAKSGEEIAGQLYAFTDKGGREVALRPEMTPTFARMLASRSRRLPKPIRWFSAPQLFRYERAQRGRLREHFQFNADIVGEAGELADAEVLAVALDATMELGLGSQDIMARVNDRRLVDAVFASLGVEEARKPALLSLIDKRGRMSSEVYAERLERLGVGDVLAREIGEASGEGGWDWMRARSRTDPKVAAAMKPLIRHRKLVRAMGFGESVVFDFSIVRGLAYYTGIVFELFDARRELRAVCGGGRYDDLLQLLGGDALPAVGFGMGDVVLGELLQSRGLLPEGPDAPEYGIAWIDAEGLEAALGLARRMRRFGRRVVYALRGASLGAQLKRLSRAGIRRVVFIGPEEAASQQAKVRDMHSGAEILRTFGEIAQAPARFAAARDDAEEESG